MMKKILIVLVLTALLFAGCFEKVAKVGCCAKKNATIDGKCALLNMTTSKLMDYYDETNGPCDDEDAGTEGHCNVTIGGKTYLVPICTDAELNECIDPECTAMVCGDFLFKPKIAPGVIGPSGDEADAEVDVPPEQEEEEARIEFYNAQCKFLKMDNKLASIMKNTDSSINVFRIGVGGSFDEFERYRYTFPISDKYCNINPEGYGISDIRVDRYMNYLGAESPTELYVAQDPEQMRVDCLNDIMGHAYDMPQFRYGQVTYPTDPDCWYEIDQEQSEYNYELLCKYTVNLDTGTEHTRGPYLRVDKHFYRRGLSIAHADTIYSEVSSRAPFECSIGSECYSGTCDQNFYNRAVNIKNTGKEVTTDCYIAEDSYGKRGVMCAPTTDVHISGGDEPPDFDYSSIPVRIAKVRIRVDSYPGSAFSEEPDDLGECEGGDNVCELMAEWRNFAGRDLGEHHVVPVLDYDYDEQIVSKSFEITMLPKDFGFEERSPSECKLLELSSSGECPYITEQDNYPPAGGAVFFGSATESAQRVYWNHEGSDVEIIGYIIGTKYSTGIYEMWLADRCEQEYEFEPPLTVAEGNDPFTCFGDCMFVCNLVGDPATTSECSAFCNGEAELPCDITGPIVGGLPFAEDLIRVEVGEPDEENWQKLMDAFEPLYVERIETLGQETNWEDGCGGRMDAPDLLFSTMPWVLEFKKKEGEKGSFISSEAAQVLYENNVFEVEHEDRVLGSLCNMRVGKKHDDDVHWNYWLLYADYIWLIKKPSDNTLGGCMVNEVTGLPEMKTYGWCEPCSGSTLAYQQVLGGSYPYITPYEIVLSKEPEEVTINTQCALDDDEINCFAPWITDVEDLNGDYEETGIPRLSHPEATMMKERLGSYLKGGVLPVLDMSDVSNWELGDYTKYPFEGIYDDMGAVIVIVDTIDLSGYFPSEAYQGTATNDQIAERTGIVKTRCWRCIPAVMVMDPPDNESLDELLLNLFTDPRLMMDVDMVAFRYNTRVYDSPGFYEGDNDEERAESTVDHMLSFSKTVLSYGKPSVIVGFGVPVDGETWNADNAHILMNKIVDRSGEFANTGTIGIIYTYVKGMPEWGGLIDYYGAYEGMKGDRYCAFQRAVNRLLTPPPSTIFSAVPVFENLSCINCTSLDYLMGECTTTCANGEECTMPEGAIPRTMRCPEGGLVAPCTLCNETPGTYHCVYDYGNGSKETRDYDYTLISSDAYMDVIGGLDAPDKCCIRDDQGTNYSYTRQVVSSFRTIPIAFPKSGNAEIDCGAKGFSELGFTSSYCGIEIVPMKKYKVNCEFIPG
jgi:hypothetical protein